MIGLHVQRGVEGWKESTAAFANGTWHKAVHDFGLARELKSINQTFNVIYRNLTQEDQTPLNTLAANKEKARRFFRQFIDGTFWQQGLWQYMQGVEEWNEHIIDFPNPEEERRFLLWSEAVADVWHHEYQKQYPNELGDTPLIMFNVPVGNDFDIEFAKICEAYRNIASYHGYMHVQDGVRDPLDHIYHSGRWMTLDEQFRTQGVKLKWISTEGGAYRSVYDGWKHSSVYDGNFTKYLADMKDVVNEAVAWNEKNDYRFYGYQAFTVGRTGEWQYYELEAPQIKAFGRLSTSPQEPDPPDPPFDPCVPRVDYKRTSLVVPQDVSLARYLEIAEEAFANRNSLLFSYDDAGFGAGILSEVVARLYDISDGDKELFEDWYKKHYPETIVNFVDDGRSLGIDISHHNSEIDWDKLKAWRYKDGRRVEFVIMKATQGIRFVDPRFHVNWRAAKNNGFKTSAYHFFENGQSGLAQALHFKRVVNGYQADMQWWLDLEQTSPPVQWVGVREWLKMVDNSGIYTGTWWLNETNPPAWIDEYAMWINNGWDNPNEPLRDWLIWQFAQVPGDEMGIGSSLVDLNEMV